jgi:hypothetical protein
VGVHTQSLQVKHVQYTTAMATVVAAAMAVAVGECTATTCYRPKLSDMWLLSELDVGILSGNNSSSTGSSSNSSSSSSSRRHRLSYVWHKLVALSCSLTPPPVATVEHTSHTTLALRVLVVIHVDNDGGEGGACVLAVYMIYIIYMIQACAVRSMYHTTELMYALCM